MNCARGADAPAMIPQSLAAAYFPDDLTRDTALASPAGVDTVLGGAGTRCASSPTCARRPATGGKLTVVELLIAVNPDPDSKLPYLLRLPLAGGMVFRTSGTWPRTKALYCYPVPAEEWPDDPGIVERLALRSCVRRGAAIDLVVDRGRENRSQLVFTKARGRDAVFWQSPRTRTQARPNVRTPTARAAGIPELQIVVDSHEQYPYHFTGQQATTVKRALPCGDYGITAGGPARPGRVAEQPVALARGAGAAGERAGRHRGGRHHPPGAGCQVARCLPPRAGTVAASCCLA